MGISELIIAYFPIIAFYCTIIISALIGSYTKIYIDYQNLPDEERSVPFGRVLISTFAGLIIILLVIEFYVFSLKLLIVIAFVAGLIGYQLLERISTIEGFISTIRDVLAIIERGLGINKDYNNQSYRNTPLQPPYNPPKEINNPSTEKKEKPNFDELKK